MKRVAKTLLGAVAAVWIGLGPSSYVLAYEWPGKLAQVVRNLKSNSENKRTQAIRELVYFPLEDVLPGLLEMLDDPKVSTSVRIEVIKALRELGASQAVDKLHLLLTHSDPDIRLQATKALGELGDQQSLQLMARTLGDVDPKVRSATIRALGRLGHDEGLGAIATMLADKDPLVVTAAMDVLADVGDRTAVFAILERVKANSSQIQVSALRALGKLGDRRAVGPLVGMLYSMYPEVQSAAVEALAQLGDPAASSHLLKLMWENHNTPLGPKILTALGRIQDPQSVQGLLQIMRYSDNAPIAADTLKQIGPRVSEKTLAALIQNRDRTFQGLCLDVLAYVQLESSDDANNARLHIAKALTPELSRDRYPKRDLLKVLLAGRHPKALGSVLTLLTADFQSDRAEDRQRAYQLRLQILEGLAGFDDTRVVQPVLSIFPKLEGAERIAAVRLLGQLGATEALPLLKNVMNEGDVHLKTTAIAAVGQMDGLEAGQILLDVLRRGGTESLAEVGYGLGANTEPKVTQALLQLARTTRGEVQFTTLQALGEHIRRESNPEAEQHLLEMVFDADDQRIQSRALDALGSRPLPDSVFRLSELYETEGSILRRKIVAIFGNWGLPSALPVLMKAARDRNTEIRAEAAWALGRVGDLQATELLIELLSDRNWAVSLNAAAALAMLKDDRSRDALLQVLKHQRGHVRANALLALSNIGAAPSRIELLRLYRRDQSAQVHEAIFRVMVTRGSDTDRDDLLYFQRRVHDPGLRRVLRQLRGELKPTTGSPWIRYVLTDGGRRMVGQRVIVALANGMLVGKVSDEAGEVRLERIPTGETRLIPLDDVFKKVGERKRRGG